MKINVQDFNKIFQQAIKDYHILDDVNQEIKNPYSDNTLEWMLYQKCFVDSIQWHLEDLIRDPNIDPVEALKIKRRIDELNQKRTDIVEVIDDYFYEKFKDVKPLPDARLNTETLGWAIDRLSILNLKLYHWTEEANRSDASEEHKQKAKQKLEILNQQYDYLNKAIEQLIEDIQQGKAIAKTYKQMKMYNDPELNPVLRKSKLKK